MTNNCTAVKARQSTGKDEIIFECSEERVQTRKRQSYSDQQRVKEQDRTQEKALNFSDQQWRDRARENYPLIDSTS